MSASSTTPVLQTTPVLTTQASPNTITSSTLITINSAAQLPIKLTNQNYPSWRAQFNSLLLGHKLLGYIDGTKPAPPAFIPSITTGTNSCNPVSNPEYELWFQQNQLLLHGIISSTTEHVLPFIASCQTSKQAWDKLTHMFANKSRSRMMNLREKLSQPKGGKFVQEYFQYLRTIADDLALINSPVSEKDLVIHALNGIGSNFKELAAGIRARESYISFEELMDKMTEYEVFLKKQETATENMFPTANIAQKWFHNGGGRFKQGARPSAKF